MSLRALLWTVLLLLPGYSGFDRLAAQTVQAGFHVGGARMKTSSPLNPEGATEYGVWVGLELDQRLDFIADWTRISQESFRLTPSGFSVGEDQRNRQIVDFTVRYHFAESGGFRWFVEGGGGSYWNNRQVYNPQGYPGFLEAGKQSTRKNLWTFGAGVRRKLAPHLDWILQGRFHNLTCRDGDAKRVLTGLMLTWK